VIKHIVSSQPAFWALLILRPRRAYWANSGAGSATRAKIRIDFVLFVAFRNSADWTVSRTRAAANAIITDMISHLFYLLFSSFTDQYIKTRGKIQDKKF
jgi:hypothetical protein